jgi:hypothetical protein
MAIRVKVHNNRQIIVPLRFTRATTGDPVADIPDVDDRGFSMGIGRGRGALRQLAARWWGSPLETRSVSGCCAKIWTMAHHCS